MFYENTRRAVFVSRPNRFVAQVLLDGAPVTCHVKNTGRCRELLLPGSEVILQRAANPERRTGWDLIAVYKGRRLINMDAAAPNAVCRDWLLAGGLGFVPEVLRPEARHGDSRFDFYLEHAGAPAYLEVKGVTLEEDGVVRFPDAPTLRGVKHLRDLCQCVREGLGAYVLFVVQMEDVRYFEPNARTHPEFAAALLQARDAGVRLLALDCAVTENSLSLRRPVEIRLPEGRP